MTPQQPGQPLQGMAPVGPNQPMQVGTPPPQQMEAPQQYEQADPQDQMENVVNSALSNLNMAKKLRNRKEKDTNNNMLDKMGEKLMLGIDADKDSRREWMKQNVEWMNQALLKKETKTYPWPKASNVKYPLLSTAAMQFSARAYPALVPADGKVVKTKYISYDPQGAIAQKAERVAKHMSYQIMCKMPGWEMDMDKLLMSMAISGICFKKTYHDSVMGVHRSDIVYPTDFIVNYWAKDLESAYRKTQVQYYTDNEIREKVLNDEEYLDIDYIKADINDPENPNTTRKLATGVDAPPTDESTPHLFYECHTFWDLDNDGYEEPYVITIHANTKKVARIIARWDLDGFKTNSNKKVIKIKPLEYYTAFPFIPNPDGSIYALGFGLLLNPLNEAANSLINQLIDAGTINNLQSGFIGKGLRMKMGIKTIAPGEWAVVNATGDDLRKQIVPLPSHEPSNVLMALLQMLITSGNQLASIAEIFVGKMPGQNTPATTTQETVKQGMAVFTAIYKRVYKALEEEFKKIFRLNAITEGIVEQENKILNTNITSSDYDNDNYIIPGGDPTGDSESAKLAKVQQVGAMLQLGTIDPMSFTQWALEVGQVPNYKDLLKKPAPPPPPDPLETAKQQTEQLKQQGMKIKQQGDMQQNASDIHTAQAIAAIKVQQETQKLAHQTTMEAMAAQGTKMDHIMGLLEKVSEQRHQAVTQAQDIVHTDATNQQALEHATAINKVKIAGAKAQAAAKPKTK